MHKGLVMHTIFIIYKSYRNTSTNQKTSLEKTIEKFCNNWIYHETRALAYLFQWRNQSEQVLTFSTE